MPEHLQIAIDALKKQVLALSAVAEQNVQKAVRAVRERDTALAAQVFESEPEINQKEVDIEEECQKVLALHQPVANDLRFIIAVLKINGELERIGDIAANIAKRARRLCETDRLELRIDFSGMADKALNMLHDSLDALVRGDTELAHRVCASDEEMNATHREIAAQLLAAIRANPNQLDALLDVLGVSRHLERIADHATNIAEDVIYLIQGRIVRHKTQG